MIALKEYQQRCLDPARDFLSRCGAGESPRAAFASVRGEDGVPYLPVSARGLEEAMPYFCLRVPTGGGKTLLGCHLAGIAIDELLHAERGVVLWLVPSNTILQQTADALRDPSHAYRRALETACAGPVEVLTIEEALRMSRATVSGQTVVIVATIQAFRVEDKTGRKVYAQSGSFQEHLQNLPMNKTEGLLRDESGGVVPSLVNVLRLHRPVVIVDEAHNARTLRSFDALANVGPACVIELTATPSTGADEIVDGKKEKMPPSNVLHRVSAAELKAAEMIKLPLRVITRHPGQRETLLAEAVALRADLERLAAAETQATGVYLRPIMLLQAVRVDECEALREKLVTDHNIPREQVVISTGALDELKDAGNVAGAKSPVRFIITVQKLREGWDCPSAYVLCSLKETRSDTAIEQLVGRILRQPGAKLKQHPDLNCAYAFSVSASIHDVLFELKAALEHNGFTAAEAERIIIPLPQGTLPLGAQPQTVTFQPAKEIDIAAVERSTVVAIGKVRVQPESGAITVLVPLADEELNELVQCTKTAEAREKLEAAAETVRETDRAFGGGGATHEPSPWQRWVAFSVPRLAVKEQGELFEFERTLLLEHPWRLSEKDATLPESYNPLERPFGRQGVIDIQASGTVTTQVQEASSGDFVVTLRQDVLPIDSRADWSAEALVAWLDRHIRHQDIPPGESAAFMRKVINGLMARYDIQDINLLALDRFRLRDVVATRIEQHREEESKAAFQQWLMPSSGLTTSEECAVDFRRMVYEPGTYYDGSFIFRKHYFGPRPGDLLEKRSDGTRTAEMRCAEFLDGLAAVDTWVRNLSRRSTSFRLQTSKDWFYPDFVCQLNDGRILVVEYKGDHLWENAQEKRDVGAVWESRSNGKCLFVMPRAGDMDDVIRQKIGR